MLPKSFVTTLVLNTGVEDVEDYVTSLYAMKSEELSSTLSALIGGLLGGYVALIIAMMAAVLIPELRNEARNFYLVVLGLMAVLWIAGSSGAIWYYLHALDTLHDDFEESRQFAGLLCLICR